MSKAFTAASTTTRPSATRSARASRPLRPALSRRCEVHGRQRLLWALSRYQALGGRRQGSRHAGAGQGHRRARAFQDRGGSGRPGRDGARAASCAHEHVHRPGEWRQLQNRQEPRRHRSQRVHARCEVAWPASSRFGPRSQARAAARCWSGARRRSPRRACGHADRRGARRGRGRHRRGRESADRLRWRDRRGQHRASPSRRGGGGPAPSSTISPTSASRCPPTSPTSSWPSASTGSLPAPTRSAPSW